MKGWVREGGRGVREGRGERGGVGEKVHQNQKRFRGFGNYYLNMYFKIKERGVGMLELIQANSFYIHVFHPTLE